VGWVPLAPGERFRRGEPFQGQLHNVPHAGAATLVERSTFASGHVMPITSRENIFVAGKYQMGAPDVHPTGNIHVGPTAPTNRLPSAAVRSVNVQQLRQQHPQLHVVTPQTHQYRPGYTPRNASAWAAPRSAQKATAPAASGQVWGNRSVQHMWWVNPKATGKIEKDVPESGNAGSSRGNFQGDNGGTRTNNDGGGRIHAPR
jgi:hypothetical protein